jgi:hypothetical protein
VKGCGKSAPRRRQRRRHGKPHREQDRIGATRAQRCVHPSPGRRPGWLLEAAGNGRPRGMVVTCGFAPAPYRTRLTGRLAPPSKAEGKTPSVAATPRHLPGCGEGGPCHARDRQHLVALPPSPRRSSQGKVASRRDDGWGFLAGGRDPIRPGCAPPGEGGAALRPASGRMAREGAAQHSLNLNSFYYFDRSGRVMPWPLR